MCLPTPPSCFSPYFSFFFLKDFIYLFLERGEGREKEGGETSMYGCLLSTPTGDMAHNPGMCPDWKLNRSHFGLQASTQSTEPHQPGLKVNFK